MGGIAKVLAFLRVTRNGAQVSDVTVDPGGGANITGENFSSAGDDSHPLPGDYAIMADIPAEGREAVVGYVDPLNTPKAWAGERRIYARDEISGDVIGEIWLKNDGSIRASNANGFFELQADGVFNVNGATIGTDGTITSPVAVVSPSMVVNGAELDAHDHAILGGSSAPGPTGPNN